MERLEISWSKFITVVVEEVVVDPTVAGFALLRAFSTRVGFLTVVELTSILSSSFFVTLTALAPFLALAVVGFLLTLSAAVTAEVAAAAAALLFFLAVVVVTEFELSTEIKEMSDLSLLVDESVSLLRRFFSFSMPPST